MGRLGSVASVASVKVGIEDILTTKGDILHRNATEAVRLAIGADNEITKVATDILNYEVAAGGGGGGAWTREGGNTTEATTTSTSVFDMLSATGLSIATDLTIVLTVAHRKTTGSASNARIGLKLNTTVTGEAVVGTVQAMGVTSQSNQTDSRFTVAWLAPRLTNYNLVGSSFGIGGGINQGDVTVGTAPARDAAQPIATITDVIIRALNGSASNTYAVDELNVYSLARS